MSDPVSYHPLSLADVFRMRDIKAYDYDGDLILTTDDGRLIHLYENEVEGRTIYGLNLGQALMLTDCPNFVGNLAAVEVSFAYDEINWDFGSLLLRNGDGASLKIKRNDASFPEPTFSRTQ